MKPKVLLGMSGGTDSSVSAMLLQQQGYEVVGLTMHLYDDFQRPGEEPTFIEEARLLADKLGIRHIVHQATDGFNKTVLDYFVSEYLAGRTPFPCVVCNKHIKWKILEEVAKQQGCSMISTGHYVRLVQYQSRNYFAIAADPDKDQSFFLWNLDAKLLEQMVFPLGGMLKTEVRALAAKLGFERVAQKKDSLGVCFIEGNDYRPFLMKCLKEKGIHIEPGNYTDYSGKVIGKHQGYPFYTIGQRRGLNHGQNRALFVTDIDAASNIVQLGEFSELKRTKIVLKNYHFYHSTDMDSKHEYIVKIRYRNQATPCHIEIIDETRMILHLHELLYSVAPGQSAVLFDDDRVVGGGFIESSMC
jgi:tRNA-uridine 2-sulfurtransferase